jgi:hypothetical protein
VSFEVTKNLQTGFWKFFMMRRKIVSIRNEIHKKMDQQKIKKKAKRKLVLSAKNDN